MIIRLTLIICICLLTGWKVNGQQDPAERDSVALSTYKSAPPQEIERATYTLIDYAAQRYREGAPTATLSEIYHQIGLAYSRWAPVQALAYLDTTTLLRSTATGVSYTQKARTAFLRGENYYSLEAYGRAEDHLAEAIELLERALAEEPAETKNHFRYNYFYLLAGQTAYSNGNWALARFYLEKSAENLRTYPSERDRLAVENMLAAVYYDQGQFDEALTLMERVKDPLGKDNPDEAGVPAMNLAIVHSLSGDTTLAETFFAEALAAHLRTHAKADNTFSRKLLLDLYSNLVEHDLRYGKLDRLPARLAEVTSYRPVGEENAVGGFLGETYLKLGAGFARRGEFQVADSLLAIGRRALLSEDAAARSNALPRVTDAVFASRPNNVFQLLEAYQQRYQSAYERSGEEEDLELAKLATRKIDTLIRAGRQGLNLTGSLRPFIQRERKYYAGAIALALQAYERTGREEDLWEAYRFAAGPKAALLKRFLGTTATAASFGVSPTRIDRKVALEVQQLVLERQLQGADPEAAPALRDSLLRINVRNNLLRDSLFAEYPSLRASLQEGIEFTQADAQRLLPNDLLLVEYFLAEEAIYVFTLSARAGLQHVRLDRPADLKRLIANQLADEAASRQLYNLLVAPALAMVKSDAISRLQFVPDTDLWPVAFAALTMEDGRPLIEQYAVSYTYSAGLLFDPEQQSAVRQQEQLYLGFGISYESILSSIGSGGGDRSAQDRNLRDMGTLPYARDEVAQAAALTAGRALLDEEATKASFLDLAGAARILHLAMHGFLDDNPLETSLVFASEGAAAYEPLSMREIIGRRFENELTVLSACHTGGGPVESSEGMQSIGRAFIAAGSKSTITSNWEANDRATHDILLSFYAALSRGETKDVALQVAVKDYLRNSTKAERQPVRWANLVVNGALQPINTQRYGKLTWFLIGLFSAGLLIWGINYRSSRKKTT